MDENKVESGDSSVLPERIEQFVWQVVYPAVQVDIDLGQLRINVADAIAASTGGGFLDAWGRAETVGGNNRRRP